MREPAARKKVKSRKSVKREPYPYTIPPVTLPESSWSKKPNLWAALEFFRIEALLRSQLFLSSSLSTDENEDSEKENFWSLCMAYNIWRNPLKGGHHELLDPDKGPFLPTKPFQPIKVLPFKKGRLSAYKYYKSGENECRVQLPPGLPFGSLMNSQLSLVAVDTAYPAETILHALRPWLQEKNARLKEDGTAQHSSPQTPPTRSRISNGKSLFPFLGVYSNPQEKSPIKSVETWIQYFRCYDAWVCEQRSYAETAKKFYNDYKKRFYVREITKKVEALISQAVKRDWPPPKLDSSV